MAHRVTKSMNGVTVVVEEVGDELWFHVSGDDGTNKRKALVLNRHAIESSGPDQYYHQHWERERFVWVIITEDKGMSFGAQLGDEHVLVCVTHPVNPRELPLLGRIQFR